MKPNLKLRIAVSKLADEYIKLIRRDTFASAEEGREMFITELQLGIDLLALEVITGVPAAE